MDIDTLRKRDPLILKDAQEIAAARGIPITVQLQPFGATLFVGDERQRCKGPTVVVYP